MRAYIHCLTLLLLLGVFPIMGVFPTAQAGTPPQVLVSIKPLALIFAEIGGDEIRVDYLLDPGASPHLYQLKPSDVARLKETEALVWVGPDLETFLGKVVLSVRPTRSILLQRELAPKLAPAQPRTEAIAQAPHAGPGERHDHHGHWHHDHHSDSDAHLWLSPELAPAIAEVAARLFSELVPERKDLFERRVANFIDGLKAVDQHNRALLDPVRERGFLVTHDAFGRFVRHYGLNQVAALSITPERMPGARHITQLRELLANARASCILVEPQIRPRYLATLTEGLEIREGVIDPLAGDIEPGAGSYGRFLQGLARAFAHCLGS